MAVFKRVSLLVSFLMCVALNGVMAQDLRALARVDNDKSSIADLSYRELEVTLQLSQPIPFRIFTLSKPDRIVFDFKEVDWSGFSSKKVLNASKVADATIPSTSELPNFVLV